jgi:hypothetical protein
MTTKVNAKQVAIALILGVGVYALLTTDFKNKSKVGPAELKSSADGDDDLDAEEYANAEGDEEESGDDVLGMDPMYDFDGDYSYGPADEDLLEADVTGKDEIMSYADATETPAVAKAAAVGKPAAVAAVVKESKEQKAAKEKAKQLAHWTRRVNILTSKIKQAHELIKKRSLEVKQDRTRIPIWTKKLAESKAKVEALSK